MVSEIERCAQCGFILGGKKTRHNERKKGKECVDKTDKRMSIILKIVL